MAFQNRDFRVIDCDRCLQGAGLDFVLTMAFQPIVDLELRNVYAYEALVRGRDGAPAGTVLGRVTRHNRYHFDQLCRVTAIRLAAACGLDTRLAINFMPNAVRVPDVCLTATLEAADRFGVPHDRLIFEMTERERLRRPAALNALRRSFAHHGFQTAIDDFGAGYAGLQLLAAFQPELIKLDRRIVRGVAADRARRAIVQGVLATAESLPCRVVAEGVLTETDLDALRRLGVTLFQGFLFAAPAVGRLPVIDLSNR